MAPTRKKCASRGIELDTWKAKVERFVPAWFVVPGIRQITERDRAANWALLRLR